MSEKKCDCEGQMIAALAAGVIMTLVVGFALGWMWDKRSGALSDVSIVGVLTAIGTLGAVVYALFSDSVKRSQQNRLARETSRLAVGLILPQLKRSVKQLIESYRESEIRLEEDGGMRDFSKFMPEYESINLNFDKEVLFLLTNSGSSIAQKLAMSLGDLNEMMADIREFIYPHYMDGILEKENVKIVVNSDELEKLWSIIFRLDRVVNEAERVIKEF